MRKAKTVTGNTTGTTSLVRDPVAVTTPATIFSHMMPGRAPMERVAVAAVAVMMIAERMTHGKDITDDRKLRHTGHGHPGDARKFAEVVNSVQLISLILSLNFLTHRMHHTIPAG